MGTKMSGKWKKLIWALLMVQMCLLHIFLLRQIRYQADYYWYRVCARLGLPGVFYGKGFWLAALGMTFVSALIILIYFMDYRRFRVQCIKGIEPVEDEIIIRKFEKARIRAGIEQTGRKTIYKNPKIAEPFVLGFYQPVILLPEWACSLPGDGMMGEAAAGGEMLDMLLFHECVHIRHNDTWYKLFLFLCNALCWYNPFAYLIRGISKRDIEIDCDETVAAGYRKKERVLYGQFLIDSLERMRTKEYIHSVFFSAGGRMMKARIAAIMEEKRPYNVIAGCAVALLVLEIIFVAGNSGKQMIKEVKEQQEPENIYEGYEKPECFTEAALERMLTLAPAAEDTYRQEMWNMSEDDQEDYSKLPYEAEGPWQVRLKELRHYNDSIGRLLYRYLSYDRDQVTASAISMEEPGLYLPLHQVYSRLLAGDHEEFVFAVVFREYWPDQDRQENELPDFARLGKDGSDYYAYYPLAVHVKMVKDYVFELQGITGMAEAVEAFREAYPENDYSDIPYFVGAPEEEKNPAYETRTSEGILEIRKSGQEEWDIVPVSLEELFTRGDEMEGRLTRLQDGSYQCDEIKQIFAYGGSMGWGGEPAVPVSVVYYDREAGAYRSSVVTRNYGSVRRIFVSFPENENKGFLVLSSDRTVWQEYTACFVTEDGGRSWQECDIGEGSELMIHSLTTDMRFITNEVGFITIRDSESPYVLRTDDGGSSFRIVTFEEPKEYYSMAYAPFFEEGKWTMDIGLEEQSMEGGIKARYVTEDLGETWQFLDFVLKQ